VRKSVGGLGSAPEGPLRVYVLFALSGRPLSAAISVVISVAISVAISVVISVAISVAIPW